MGFSFLKFLVRDPLLSCLHAFWNDLMAFWGDGSEGVEGVVCGYMMICFFCVVRDTIRFSCFLLFRCMTSFNKRF